MEPQTHHSVHSYLLAPFYFLERVASLARGKKKVDVERRGII